MNNEQTAISLGLCFLIRKQMLFHGRSNLPTVTATFSWPQRSSQAATLITGPQRVSLRRRSLLRAEALKAKPPQGLSIQSQKPQNLASHHRTHKSHSGHSRPSQEPQRSLAEHRHQLQALTTLTAHTAHICSNSELSRLSRHPIEDKIGAATSHTPAKRKFGNEGGPRLVTARCLRRSRHHAPTGPTQAIQTEVPVKGKRL
eukprot:TRINITY_DN2233_c0_g1_i1.p1 TRINITY_DN2233_c0_g1~~TRINITY_DN2233_c0_g1_i1.p1  ORF type:complete len:201 (-),score=4.55 TRINITY_DN2233_c0_g1_i1:408-1010(-)